MRFALVMNMGQTILVINKIVTRRSAIQTYSFLVDTDNIVDPARGLSFAIWVSVK